MSTCHEKFLTSIIIIIVMNDCRDDEKMRMRRNGVPCTITTSRVTEFLRSEETHDLINNVINSIVEMRIYFHDVTIKTSQEHTLWKIGGWICSCTFDSFDKEELKDRGNVPLGFLRILKRSKVLLVGKHGLTVVRNFEDLTELGKSESYDFMLNHKGDDKIAIFIGFNHDLTIEIKNESEQTFLILKRTIVVNVSERRSNVLNL
ncbi:hypothetical protein Tco_0335660 [Tanacetum coccineum]